jgi:alpha-mannosidase
MTCVHLLAAADGDATSTIKIDDAERPFNVPNWTGFIGQWDSRLWDKPIQELDYDPSEKMVGLVPGFIKRTPVAWFATHHNTPQGDAYYEYSYLFQLSYDVPAGARTLTLPNNSQIRIFAVSVSREPAATPAAAPLYDTLADHQPGGAPLIPQAGQTFNEGVNVTIIPPLYYQQGDTHYTLDGSDPTAASPVYDGPFFADDTVKIAVRQFDAGGQGGPITRGVITVHDVTPPQLTDALMEPDQPVLDLTFSKKLDPATAADASRYKVSPPLAITGAELSPDGLHVALTFGGPPSAGTLYNLSLSGIKDTSPSGNAMPLTTKTFNAGNIVYALAGAKLPEQALSSPVAGLPLQGTDQWTLNVFVRPAVALEDRTIIAGFGDYSNNPNRGFGRYFAFFQDGIRLWSSNSDVVTNSPLDVGRWQMLTASYDGKSMTVYKDGEIIKKQDVDLSTDPQSNINLGQPDPWEAKRQFHGDIQFLSVRRGAMNANQVKNLFDQQKPVE